MSDGQRERIVADMVLEYAARTRQIHTAAHHLLVEVQSDDALRMSPKAGDVVAQLRSIAAMSEVPVWMGKLLDLLAEKEPEGE